LGNDPNNFLKRGGGSAIFFKRNWGSAGGGRRILY
jgi:hypothetical protein